MSETTRAVFNLLLSGTLDRFPNVQIIVPHAGATIPVLADRVAGLSPALGLPEQLDASKFMASLRGMYYDLAGFPLPRQLKALLEIADPKHIFYGSDYLYTPEALVTTLATQLDDSAQLTTAYGPILCAIMPLLCFHDLLKGALLEQTGSLLGAYL